MVPWFHGIGERGMAGYWAGGGLRVGGRGFGTKPSVLPHRIVRSATGTVLSFGNSNLSLVRVDRHTGSFRPIISRTMTLFGRLLGVPRKCSMLFLNNNTDVRFYVMPCGFLRGGTTCLGANM